MSTDVVVSKLKINVLSKSQYEALTPSNEELYFVEDSNVEFVIAVSSTAPATATTGDKYCNTSSNKLYTYDGTTWSNPKDFVVNCFYVDTTDHKLYIYNGTTLILVSGSTSPAVKTSQSNPELITDGTHCTWNVSLSSNDYIVRVQKIATGEDIRDISGVGSYILLDNKLTVTFNSTTNIAADTYRAIIVG